MLWETSGFRASLHFALVYELYRRFVCVANVFRTRFNRVTLLNNPQNERQKRLASIEEVRKNFFMSTKHDQNACMAKNCDQEVFRRGLCSTHYREIREVLLEEQDKNKRNQQDQLLVEAGRWLPREKGGRKKKVAVSIKEDTREISKESGSRIGGQTER